MVKFQLNIANPSISQIYKYEIGEDSATNYLIGRRIGEEIEGDPIGFEGYQFKITGGSDRDGFPMHPGVHGGFRKKILISKGIGYKPKRDGVRKKKTVRGNVITEDSYQINIKILQSGSKKIEEILAEASSD